MPGACLRGRRESQHSCAPVLWGGLLSQCIWAGDIMSAGALGAKPAAGAWLRVQRPGRGRGASARWKSSGLSLGQGTRKALGSGSGRPGSGCRGPWARVWWGPLYRWGADAPAVMGLEGVQGEDRTQACLFPLPGGTGLGWCLKGAELGLGWSGGGW